MEPREATPFLSHSSRISRSHPSLPTTWETEEKYRPASGSPFPVSSVTASETSSDNNRQTWLHREQWAGTSFMSSNQLYSSTLPPAAASPGKSFFPCIVLHLLLEYWPYATHKIYIYIYWTFFKKNNNWSFENVFSHGFLKHNKKLFSCTFGILQHVCKTPKGIGQYSKKYKNLIF